MSLIAEKQTAFFRPAPLRLGSARMVFLGALAMLALSVSHHAQAASAELKVDVGNVLNGQPIPARHAYCTAAPGIHTKEGGNVSPTIGWSGAPKETKSFAVIMHDTDVPADFTHANKENETIHADAPRKPAFYHWVLVNIPASIDHIAQRAEGDGVDKAGKPDNQQPYGLRGNNDVSRMMQAKQAGGYDGPCPPWNDARLHHYHFTVYALNTATLSLPAHFGGEEAMRAIEGHILAQGSVTGTFTQNPQLTDAGK